MTPERWQRVKRLFEAALERTPTTRPEFLAGAAADDPTLVAEVLALFASEQRAGAFLSGTPDRDAGSALDAPSAFRLEGRRLGPYRLLAEIGRGGMGTVYRAVRADDQYEKQVAVKVISGWVSAFVRERFRTERQILANLDHPNIARLIDGGTTEEGWPYLVMEYVEGEPIDRYCDTHRLDTAGRLQLFRTVCAAVQHAHRSLVVHRDIKPGNILVTAEGAPKLLDFGIAKLLDPGTGAADGPPPTGIPLMTPDYASPEQVRGEPITTASDVYSLGVLLYELLTGGRPYRVAGASLEEVLKAICETPVPRPSAVAPRATGTDIDAIVLKALSKEPLRRYGSAEDLAEDIRRHLEGHPVRARADSLGYRARKFVGRHRAAVAGALLAVVGLLGATGVALREARRAEAERARAERRFNDVRKLANSFVFEVHDSIRDLEGATKAREIIVKRALEYLDSLRQEANDDPLLLEELAAAYERVGDVQGDPAQANLGDANGSLQSQRKALAIRARLSTLRPADAPVRASLVDSYLKVARLLRDMGRAADCLANARLALAVLDRSGASESDARRQAQTAKAYALISRALYAAGDVKGAEEAAQKQVDGLVRASNGAPRSPEAQKDLAMALITLGDAQLQGGRRGDALEHFRRALPLIEAAVAAEPRNTRLLFIQAIVYERMGDITTETGDTDGALEWRRKAAALAQASISADPNDARSRYLLFVAYYKLGGLLSVRKQWPAALATDRRALRLGDAVTAEDPADSWKRYLLAGVHFEIGEALLGGGDAARAVEAYQHALAIDQALNAADPSDAEYRETLAETYAHLARALTATSKAREAVELLDKAKAILEPLLADEPGNGKRRAEMAGVYGGLGQALARLPDKRDEACGWYRRSAAAWHELQAEGPLSFTDVEAAARAVRDGARCGSSDVTPPRS